MSTYSSTATYTVADVQNVMLDVKTDLVMIANATKAMTENEAARYAHDIEALVKKNHLRYADVTLMRGSTEVRAVKYEFETDGATGSSHPGGVLWPLTPKEQGGRIRVHLTYNEWSSAEDRKLLSLEFSWVPSSTDISHKELKSSGGRGYSSNSFVANRKDYS